MRRNEMGSWMQMAPEDAAQFTAISPVSLSTTTMAATRHREDTSAEGRESTKVASKEDVSIVSLAFESIVAIVESESPGWAL